MALTRRQLIVGGAGIVATGGLGLGLVELGVLPGRARLHGILGWDGGAGEIPDVTAGPVTKGTFDSAAMATTPKWMLLRPPGNHSELPLVLALHGRGGSAESLLTLGWDRYLASAVMQGVPAFAILAVDGGDIYWHRRQSGADPIAMINDELLPRVGKLCPELVIDRVGLAGWSMGGYGALLLAELWGADRVAAVSALSPAVFADFAAASDGAFDDADDFAAHDVVAEVAELTGISVQLLCGADDPFAPATEQLLQTITPRPDGAILTGGHNDRFWTRVAPDQMRFLGMALAAGV